MPYRSDAQRRFFHAAAARGDISPKTVEHWDEASRGQEVPEKVSANKSDVAGPELQMSEKGKKKFYEDIIFNEDNYRTKQPIIQKNGQWSMEPVEKAKHKMGTKWKTLGPKPPKKKKPKQEPTAPEIPTQENPIKKGELSELGMDNKIKTHNSVIAGGFHSEFIKCDANGQWSLHKSNYGPKGSGAYTAADNAKRKSRNTEQVLEGPNKYAKKYTSAKQGTARQQAAKQAADDAKRNKRQPLTSSSGQMHLVPEEIKIQGAGPSIKWLRDNGHVKPEIPKKTRK